MQTTHLGADECLDPALMSAFEDGAVDPFRRYADADAGPPSPFDMSTIDPDLLALYPEQNGGGDVAAASPTIEHAVVQDRCLSPPPLLEEPSTTSMPTHDTVSETQDQSPPKKRVRFAYLPLRTTSKDPSTPAPRVSSSASDRPVTRGQSRKRPPRLSAPSPKKHSALGVAKRTISDGTLIPPSPCTRCEWEDEECLIKYPGAACNVCRRRGRKCELVDESVKYNGQRAKDLMRADGSGSGCVEVV